MIWAPATNIDLIANFVEMYASWKFIGPVLTSVTLVSLAPEMQDRMGMQAEAFLELALPIIAKMFVYDLLAKPVDQVDATLARNLGMLEMLLKGKVPQEAFESLKVWIGEEMRQKEEQLRAVGAIRNIDIAYGLFKDDLSKEIEGIRNMEVVNPFLASYRASCDSSTNCNLAKNVKFYSPPATLHRTLMGLHPRNPHVTVKVVGTVMDASDVDFKEGVKKTVCDLKNLSCQEIR